MTRSRNRSLVGLQLILFGPASRASKPLLYLRARSSAPVNECVAVVSAASTGSAQCTCSRERTPLMTKRSSSAEVGLGSCKFMLKNATRSELSTFGLRGFVPYDSGSCANGSCANSGSLTAPVFLILLHFLLTRSTVTLASQTQKRKKEHPHALLL